MLFRSNLNQLFPREYLRYLSKTTIHRTYEAPAVPRRQKILPFVIEENIKKKEFWFIRL